MPDGNRDFPACREGVAKMGADCRRSFPGGNSPAWCWCGLPIHFVACGRGYRIAFQKKIFFRTLIRFTSSRLKYEIMKKIIAAIDGLNYSDSTVAYAVCIAKQERAHLVGVFPEDISNRSYALYELVDESGISDQRIRELANRDRDARARSVDRFELACQQSGLQYSVHKDKDIAIDALLHESIYADLMIIESKESFNRLKEDKPSRFLQHLLAEAVCPILLVPAGFIEIDKSVLLYDGSPSSVYAIKMFDYTLPGLKYKPAEVISVKSPASSLHLPDGKLMKEFMKRHYPHADYQVLQGVPWEVIPAYLQKESSSTIIVLGAYHRGRLSRWFYPSMADVLLYELQSPLFIAHCK